MVERTLAIVVASSSLEETSAMKTLTETPCFRKTLSRRSASAVAGCLAIKARWRAPLEASHSEETSPRPPRAPVIRQVESGLQICGGAMFRFGPDLALASLATLRRLPHNATSSSKE